LTASALGLRQDFSFAAGVADQRPPERLDRDVLDSNARHTALSAAATSTAEPSSPRASNVKAKRLRPDRFAAPFDTLGQSEQQPSPLVS